jgi:hypothetical protein
MDPLDRLADIEMLPPPSAPGGAGVVALAIIAVAALIWYLRKARSKESAPVARAPHQEALQRLDALRAEWLHGAIDDREAAYRLCTLLRIGLGLERLDPEQAPVGLEAETWRSWHLDMQRARYPASGHPLTEALFATAASWLQGRDRHA